MKHSLSLDQVLNFIQKTGMTLGPDERKKLLQYAQLIRLWVKRQNLISYGDQQHLFERHFLPGFFIASQLEPTADTRLIDIGSGSGFLPVILKIIHPGWHVTAIDSSRKKCLFLTEINESLKLGLQVVHQRMETFRTDRANYFDYATSRGVTNLSELWNWARSVLKRTGRLWVLKGGDISQEIAVLHTGGVKTKIHTADISWAQFSAYLRGKFLVEMEIENG